MVENKHLKRYIRLTICIAFTCVVAAGAGQQQPSSQPAWDGGQEAPTGESYHFGEQLGETLDTFLSRRNDSVANICFREEHPDKKTERGNRLMRRLGVPASHLCAEYSAGNVTRKETSHNELARAISDLGASSPKRSEVTELQADSQQRSWIFENHKLAHIITVYDGHPDTEQQWRWLTEKYGSPTSKRIETYQNGFGARWECEEAVWKLPDGEGVAARESIGTGNAMWFTVDFQSREAVQMAEKDPGKPNPY
jgi:hypothetical protein